MAKTKEPIKIIGERDIELNLSNLEHHNKIAAIGKAISSPARLKILNLLKNTTLSIQEIARILELPVSSTAAHIKCLEETGLVVTESQPGMHGSMRVCICSMQKFTLNTFDSDMDITDNTVMIDMPVGHYYQCSVEPTCGLADEVGGIGTYDTPSAFFSPNRMRAQLLWFQQGYVEYRFQNLLNPMLPLSELSFSMELCSEASGFLEDWPSDITISVNGHEIMTYRSPGDFGARRGKITPEHWPNGRTQYGLLKTFSVRQDGCYLDKELVHSRVCLADLELEKKQYISLMLEVKEDAENVGGVNLFGEKFGDFNQGIVMSLIY